MDRMKKIFALMSVLVLIIVALYFFRIPAKGSKEFQGQVTAINDMVFTVDGYVAISDEKITAILYFVQVREPLPSTTKQFSIIPETKIFKAKIMGNNVPYKEEPASVSEIQVGTQLSITYKEQKKEPALSTRIVILDLSAISQENKNEGFTVYYFFREEDVILSQKIEEFADEYNVEFKQIKISADKDFNASNYVGIPLTVKIIPALAVTARGKGPMVLAIQKDVPNDLYIRQLRMFYAQPADDTILK